ncbi:hypothetical protein GQ43DRAFT_446691 [Delitschia confertaspora ATCC 74209]|uniref:Rhodopsin domain-containing protein n=1 Tax=Delitschia confertaspora ATCC 74209 TaxID=1513339 RepID=A0A9P4JRY8_9PLEO|nr:hypothetical protein GQ43DRAFT_446691 [Delitschia confertaspora ATCC 74209]
MVKSVPIENSGQVGILVASSVSIFIAALSVGLRLLAKRISSRFDYSDYCIIAALVWNCALHACCMLLVTHGGFGFHTQEIYTRFGPDTATFFFKGIMAFALLWNATVCFSKLSVLLMYTALIPVRSMVVWARRIGALVILWNLGDIIGGFLICRPLARNWNFTIKGTCGSQPNYYFAMGIINIITDVFIIVLPIPYLYRLHLSMRKKMIAMALLSIGIMTWVITIYRQTTLPGLDFTDMTYDGVLATLLSGLEPAVAIVLACIPLLRPLFGSHKLKENTSSKYGYRSGGGSELYSKKGMTKSGNREFQELEDDNDDSGSQVELKPHTQMASATSLRRQLSTRPLLLRRGGT